MEEKNKNWGFKKGLNAVFNSPNCSAAQYTKCLQEAKEICTTTEPKNSSLSSYYSKMNGRMPMSVAEAEKMDNLFARYGVTDWQGIE